MTRTEIIDTTTGARRTVHADSHGVTQTPALLADSALDAARQIDSDGHGTDLVTRVGPTEIRTAMGPTPYPTTDGSATAAWLDQARAHARTAGAAQDALDDEELW